MDGIRKSKTVNGVVHDYLTLNGKVMKETYGDVVVCYRYDNAGNPYKIIVKEGSSTYTGYYVLNQQGDVIAIIDELGNLMLSYKYNAWGVQVGYKAVENTNGDKFYEYNALKYRGYYYDAETGFYYLQSRYYDPILGRFINADGHMSTGQDFIGYNMYAYCGNNPVNMSDTSGNWPKWLENTVKVVSVVVTVVAVVATVAAVSIFTAGTGSTAAVYGATILLGAALSGINGGVANEAKGNSYTNGYVGGATGGAIQAICSNSPAGTIIGGGVGVTEQLLI